MEDFLMEFEELEELGLTNEFVIKSHKTAEMLRKKGINIKKPVWKNLKAS